MPRVRLCPLSSDRRPPGTASSSAASAAAGDRVPNVTLPRGVAPSGGRNPPGARLPWDGGTGVGPGPYLSFAEDLPEARSMSSRRQWSARVFTAG